MCRKANSTLRGCLTCTQRVLVSRHFVRGQPTKVWIPAASVLEDMDTLRTLDWGECSPTLPFSAPGRETTLSWLCRRLGISYLHTRSSRRRKNSMVLWSTWKVCRVLIVKSAPGTFVAARNCQWIVFWTRFAISWLAKWSASLGWSLRSRKNRVTAGHSTTIRQNCLILPGLTATTSWQIRFQRRSRCSETVPSKRSGRSSPFSRSCAFFSASTTFRAGWTGSRLLDT
mmetsp:Transcript_3645/g.9966  ORF Transcript_3645/g.9966 Transcript_3645/m.9966 type:complete len:228 (+) Transcript_3645:1277-1960(+)